MAAKKLENTQESEIRYDYRVKLYPDGKYHWMYDLHLLKNPMVLIDVCKVLGITLGIVACILFLIQACDTGMSLEGLGTVGKIMGIMVAIMAVLGLLGYLLYAAISGWIYTVHFIMDEKGVVHQQAPKAGKIARRIGMLNVLAGMASGKPGVMGTGMLSASHTSMATDFASVRKVKALRRMDTIKVNESFEKNRVYVNKDDFDFVYEYICSRCPKAKVI